MLVRSHRGSIEVEKRSAHPVDPHATVTEKKLEDARAFFREKSPPSDSDSIPDLVPADSLKLQQPAASPSSGPSSGRGASNNEGAGGSGNSKVADKTAEKQETKATKVSASKPAASQAATKAAPPTNGIAKAATKSTVPGPKVRTSVSASTAANWAKIWQIIENSPKMVDDPVNIDRFRKYFSKNDFKMSAPGTVTGPICANPECGEYGHTLAVCPRPVCPEMGDMVGCFFCNTCAHEVDAW